MSLGLQSHKTTWVFCLYKSSSLGNSIIATVTAILRWDSLRESRVRGKWSVQGSQKKQDEGEFLNWPPLGTKASACWILWDYLPEGFVRNMTHNNPSEVRKGKRMFTGSSPPLSKARPSCVNTPAIPLPGLYTPSLIVPFHRDSRAAPRDDVDYT